MGGYCHDKKKRHGRLDLIARISAYYVATQNDSALERLVRCRSPATRGLLYKLVSQMDEKPRFLYGQMLISILWLQSRGKPRAKSIDEVEFGPCSEITQNKVRTISVYLNGLSDPWIVGPIRFISVADPSPGEGAAR